MPALSLASALMGAARIIAVAMLAALVFSGGVGARDLSSRLGSPPPQSSGSATPPVGSAPVELMVLSQAGPLAADGAGQLFMLGNGGAGYDLLRLRDAQAGVWETVYRRKSAFATSVALGWDGTICVGLLSGVDCIDPLGRVAHYSHELLSGIVSLAIAPDGHVWALRSDSGGTLGLELVRAVPRFTQVGRVLSLRQSVEGFAGNGLAAAADGSVLMPVIENDVHRLLRVQPDGRFTRVGDFWRLGGGIAVAQGETALLGGIKRPQSLEEQRAPFDVVYAQQNGGAPGILVQLPQSRGGLTRLASHAALGGDGYLYLTRHERVRLAEGAPVEAPVLWRIPVGAPLLQGAGARAIDFSIPYIETLAGDLPNPPEYAGPLLIGRGKPLVIEGINFDGKQGTRQVLIGGVRARIESWSGERIVARVPAALESGPAEVRVAIDQAASDPERFEVKTPDTPGWFQIGSPSMQSTISNNMAISGYTGLIEIEGVTERGEVVRVQEVMETPGLYSLRLPNGLYTATFKASFLFSEVRFESGFTYAGSRFVPVQIEEQAVVFVITDDDPAVVWMPEMI